MLSPASDICNAMRSALDRSHPWIVVCRKLPDALFGCDTSDFPHVSVGYRVISEGTTELRISDAVPLHGSCQGGHLSVRCISQYLRSRFRQSGRFVDQSVGRTFKSYNSKLPGHPHRWYQAMTDAVFAAKLPIGPIIFGHSLMDPMVLMAAFLRPGENDAQIGMPNRTSSENRTHLRIVSSSIDDIAHPSLRQ